MPAAQKEPPCRKRLGKKPTEKLALDTALRHGVQDKKLLQAVRSRTAVHPAKKAGGRLKTVILAAFCAAAAAGLLLTPGPALQGASQGLTLCADVIIPSLFPFLCLSGLCISAGLARRCGRLLEPLMRWAFRLPGATGLILGLGIIGGYPVGASATAGLYKTGAVTKSEAERLLCFCINSGPAFIIGAVGAGMLRSAQAGFLLYGAHIGASLCVGLCLRLFVGHGEHVRREKAARTTLHGELPPAAAFVHSVADAGAGMIPICAFVVLFACLLGVLRQTGILPFCTTLLAQVLPGGPKVSAAVMTGLLEVTNGCAAAAGCPYSLFLISAMLSWSGLSVQFQVMAALGGTGLSTRRFVLTRPLHMAFSLALTALLFYLFPVALPTFAAAQTVLVPAFHTAPACAALFLMCGMLLLAMLTV